MTMRTIATWAGALVAATSSIGCTNSTPFTRPNPSTTPKIAAAPKAAAPTPVGAQPTRATVAAPTNGSAWANNAPANRTNTGNGPVPISPAGTMPAMSNQPAAGVLQTGGIVPPTPPTPGVPISANTPPVPENAQPVLPTAVPPVNGTIAEAQKTPVQVATRTPPSHSAPADETVPPVGPPTPSMDMPLPPAAMPTGLSQAPVMLSSSLPPLPPIKVRQ